MNVLKIYYFLLMQKRIENFPVDLICFLKT